MMLVVGFGFICSGAWNAWSTQRFLDAAARVDGIVVAIKRHEHKGSGSGRDRTPPSTTFAPVIEFDAADHERVRFEATSNAHASFVIGQRVGVRYRADAPEQAVIDAPGHEWETATGLALFGALFAGGGALLLVLRNRERNAQIGS
jgi:hypothetical protein